MLRIAGLLFTGVAILTAAAGLYIKTDHAKQLFLGKVNQAIPGTIVAGGWDFSISDGGIRLSDVAVQDPDGATCIRFNTLMIRIKPGSLLNKTLEIEDILLDRLDIRAIINETGRLNLADAFIDPGKSATDDKKEPVETTGLPVNILVNKARIINSSLGVTTPTDQIEITAFTLTLTDADLFERRCALTAKIGNSRAVLNEKTVTLETLTLASRLEQGRAINFTLGLESDLCRLSATGSCSGQPDHPEIDLAVTATSQLDALARFLKEDTPVSGHAALVLTGKGTVNNPDVRINLDLTDYQVAGTHSGESIRVSAALSDRKLTLEKAAIRLFETVLTLQGEFDLTGWFPNGFLEPAGNINRIAYGLSFDAVNGDFAHFEPWTRGISGRFSSTGTVSGSGIEPPALDADMAFTAELADFRMDGKVEDLQNLQADVQGTIEKGVLTIGNCTAITGAARAAVSGWFDLNKNSLAATAEIETDDLAATLAPLGVDGVHGRIQTHLDISGKLENPLIQATVSGAGLGLGTIAADHLALTGSLESSGRAALENLLIRQGETNIRVRGSAALFEPGFRLKETIDAGIRVEARNLNPGRYLAGVDMGIPPDVLSDNLDLDLDINLGYETAASPDASGILDKAIPMDKLMARIDFNNREIALLIDPILTLTTTLDAESSRHTTTIDFTGGPLAPMLKACGVPGIQAAITGRVISVGNLPENLKRTAQTELNRAGGELAVHAELAGSFRKPDIKASIDLNNIDYDLSRAGITLSALTGNIAATPETITINSLSGGINQGILGLRGSINLEDHKPTGATLDLRARDITLPIPLASGKTETLHINSLDTELAIELEPPPLPREPAQSESARPIPVKHLDAAIDLAQKTLSLALDRQTDCTASFDPNTRAVGINLAFNNTDLTPFLLAAGISSLGGKLAGRLQGNAIAPVNLSQDVLTPLNRARGTMSLTADLDGSLEEPVFQAALDLSQIAWGFPQAQFSLTGLGGKITASNRRIAIENLTANMGNGTIAMDGILGIEGVKLVTGDLRLTGENIFLSIPDTAECAFSTDLVFKGGPDNSNLSGTLTLIDGQFFKQIIVDIPGAVTEKKRRTAIREKTGDSPVPWLHNTNLDIDIDYKNPFVVDNNLAFLLIEPDITVTGTVSNPIVTGRTTIIEGTVTYQRKAFEIEKGIIDFLDPYAIDPDITINAKTEIRDWTIFMDVSGRKDNLNFRLYSDPQETHEDILSLLIAGKTTQELGKKSSGSATGFLTDKAAELLGKGVADATPLDTFKLGYQDNGEHGGNVNITMGKKLSRRLAVTYSMDTVEEETVHTNAAEYKLLENFSVKTFNDSKGDFGTEFSFKLEFR